MGFRSDGLKSVVVVLKKSCLHRCISIKSNAINNVKNTKKIKAKCSPTSFPLFGVCQIF